MMLMRHSRQKVLLVAIVAALLVFVTGFSSPTGVAHAILYVPVVVASMWSTRRSDPLMLAGLCTALAAVGAELHPEAESLGVHVWINTALAGLAIWITAAGVRLRMSTEQELRESEEEMRAVLNTAIDGVITSDEWGVITSINPAAEEIFGYSHGELDRANISVLMPSPFSEEHDAYVKRYLKTGEKKIIGVGREVVGLRKDGEEVPLELGVSEWGDGGRRFTAILRDLTDRRRLEAEIRQGQKLEAIGQLAGGIAHDFNNLLMGVIGCCRIARSSENTEEIKAQVIEVHGAAERGAVLTRQLLNFSRRKDLSPEPVLIDEVITRLKDMLARLLTENFDLHIDLQAPSARVLIDPGQVEQILMNLAINGRDALGERGHLRVETAVESCEEIGLGGGGGDPRTYVKLEITDNGCGMTEEVQAKAFDPFFTTKAPTEGTGLGLSTVYGLVRHCGGHIHLTSAPGKGTNIKLHLPTTDVEITPREAPKRAERQGTPGKTILVVEDDRLVRAGLGHLLRELGYEVLLATCGAEALSLCEERAQEINLVLTDILMPGMSGGELVGEIGTRYPKMQHLFMSALPTEVLIERGNIAEGEASILKPCSDEDLAEAIAIALKR